MIPGQDFYAVFGLQTEILHYIVDYDCFLEVSAESIQVFDVDSLSEMTAVSVEAMLD